MISPRVPSPNRDASVPHFFSILSPPSSPKRSPRNKPLDREHRPPPSSTLSPPVRLTPAPPSFQQAARSSSTPKSRQNLIHVGQRRGDDATTEEELERGEEVEEKSSIPERDEEGEEGEEGEGYLKKRSLTSRDQAKAHWMSEQTISLTSLHGETKKLLGEKERGNRETKRGQRERGEREHKGNMRRSPKLRILNPRTNEASDPVLFSPRSPRSCISPPPLISPTVSPPSVTSPLSVTSPPTVSSP
eukprot:CAMPEP_0201504848 /NCGR_PEP_ID=MMETSP0151_2-20130828/85438_1 /ASSEMBLY_ACC=CAM_ASM_000257 /TAXON_ID=200890 /ORGANISM="Paramoeba atlantica, Strain 621/1 / CCAP 1560/9" /LENGTH=245 /DNA_ID=CAMNT_0047898645 /DNA_START=485 /DNA_END=1218 /DNA_ORIENTATION=-